MTVRFVVNKMFDALKIYINPVENKQSIPLKSLTLIYSKDSKLREECAVNDIATKKDGFVDTYKNIAVSVDTNNKNDVDSDPSKIDIIKAESLCNIDICSSEANHVHKHVKQEHKQVRTLA